MIAAVAAQEPGLRALVAPHFARCACFIVVDSETREWRALPNPGSQLAGEAGIRAAQFIADHGAEIVIGGDFGPNAVAALKGAAIRLCLAQAETVAAALDACLAGRLAELHTASWATHPRAREAP
jgi:predicted Fe-Mo cluster-binding NifX family protein